MRAPMATRAPDGKLTCLTCGADALTMLCERCVSTYRVSEPDWGAITDTAAVREHADRQARTAAQQPNLSRYAKAQAGTRLRQHADARDHGPLLKDDPGLLDLRCVFCGQGRVAFPLHLCPLCLHDVPHHSYEQITDMDAGQLRALAAGSDDDARARRLRQHADALAFVQRHRCYRPRAAWTGSERVAAFRDVHWIGHLTAAAITACCLSFLIACLVHDDVPNQDDWYVPIIIVPLSIFALYMTAITFWKLGAGLARPRPVRRATAPAQRSARTLTAQQTAAGAGQQHRLADLHGDLDTLRRNL